MINPRPVPVRDRERVHARYTVAGNALAEQRTVRSSDFLPVGFIATPIHAPVTCDDDNSQDEKTANQRGPTLLTSFFIAIACRLRYARLILFWRMAGNVSIEQDAADNWKPSKKTNCERIEGIVALVIGLDLASRQNELQSIYATPGNLAL